MDFLGLIYENVKKKKFISQQTSTSVGYRHFEVLGSFTLYIL